MAVARGRGPEGEIVTGVAPEPRSPAQVQRAFRALLDGGTKLRPAGAARSDPGILLRRYLPRFELRLFGARFFLTNLREDPNFRFFVAYVGLGGERPRALHPRLFYKDVSLVWRCATHYILSDTDNWIGKGDVKPVVEDGEVKFYSAEETTNLPLELQGALDELTRRSGPVRRDERAAGLVLRRAPDERVEPYPDFSGPRARARAKRSRRVNGGRTVAWFERSNEPESLRFEPGYEPDFGRLLETTRSASRMYGGEVLKMRFLSANARIQYQFVAGPHQVWIIPPQSLDTELMTYGVRTVDVAADENLCVPAYEYHYMDDSEDPPRLYSQIPPGFAGPASAVDPSRADASPWIERLPVIQRFRAQVKLPWSAPARAALGAALAFALAFASAALAPVRARADGAPLDARLAKIYADVCATCHASPETRAPLAGSPETWRDSLSRGPEVQLERAVMGYRGMPPLGTCGACSEDDLRLLIAFMAGSAGSGGAK